MAKENDRLREKYESTPERALKALVEKHFPGRSGQLAVDLGDGYKLFTFTHITAEDIE